MEGEEGGPGLPQDVSALSFVVYISLVFPHTQALRFDYQLPLATSALRDAS